MEPVKAPTKDEVKDKKGTDNEEDIAVINVDEESGSGEESELSSDSSG